MIKKATLGMLVMLLLVGLIGINKLDANAQTASPSQTVITVSNVPTGTKALAVEVTVDTAVIKLGSASSNVSGALVVVGSNSEGIGVIATSGDLPASVTLTVPLTGVAEGTSMFSVGMVLDMIGGTEIVGASAVVDVSSISVAAGGGPTPTPAPSGPGGMLSADTITVSVNGQSVNETNAINVTLTFSDSAVASLDSGVTFMANGATQLLTDVNTTTNVLTAVWDGTITDGVATITAMLKAGSKAGSTDISVSKVEAAGGTDVTTNVVATVSPSSVTNAAAGGTTDVGSFTFIGPSSVVGPGKAAFAFEVSNLVSGASATLNGAMVEFADSNMVGIAIVDVPASGSIALSLMASAGSATSNVDLGTVTVTAGSGKPPVVKSAVAVNKKASTKLTVAGKRLKGASVEIVPTDRESTSVKAKGSSVVAKYSAEECIPKGSYVNVSTAGGTGAKKAKVRGSCDNPLVE